MKKHRKILCISLILSFLFTIACQTRIEYIKSPGVYEEESKILDFEKKGSEDLKHQKLEKGKK